MSQTLSQQVTWISICSHLCPGSQQQLHSSGPAKPGSKLQQGLAFLVLQIHIPACLQEGAQGGDIPSPGSPAQEMACTTGCIASGFWVCRHHISLGLITI